eukprot:1158855-Pelagomonas_calceolata.AAC.2
MGGYTQAHTKGCTTVSDACAGDPRDKSKSMSTCARCLSQGRHGNISSKNNKPHIEQGSCQGAGRFWLVSRISNRFWISHPSQAFSDQRTSMYASAAQTKDLIVLPPPKTS